MFRLQLLRCQAKVISLICTRPQVVARHKLRIVAHRHGQTAVQAFKVGELCGRFEQAPSLGIAPISRAVSARCGFAGGMEIEELFFAKLQALDDVAVWIGVVGLFLGMGCVFSHAIKHCLEAVPGFFMQDHAKREQAVGVLCHRTPKEIEVQTPTGSWTPWVVKMVLAAPRSVSWAAVAGLSARGDCPCGLGSAARQLDRAFAQWTES